jgi:hypothetical protein
MKFPTNNLIETTPRFMVDKSTWHSEHMCSVCHKRIMEGYGIYEYEVILFGFSCSQICADMLILQNI